MASNTSPFSGLLTDTEQNLRRNGYEQNNFSGLSEEQQSQIQEIISAASSKDVYDQLISLSRAINEQNAVISGINSDSININVDPQTKESTWEIKPEVFQGAEFAEAALPAITWEDRYKVLTVVVVDEAVAWGVDYIRSVSEEIE